MERVAVYGVLPAKNPLLGSFHHAPLAKNAGSKYFESQLISLAEYEKNKRLRNNPFTGQFHRGPSSYSDLHNLRKLRSFRRASSNDEEQRIKLTRKRSNHKTSREVDRELKSDPGIDSETDDSLVFAFEDLSVPNSSLSTTSSVSADNSNADSISNAQWYSGFPRAAYSDPNNLDRLSVQSVAWVCQGGNNSVVSCDDKESVIASSVNQRIERAQTQFDIGLESDDTYLSKSLPTDYCLPWSSEVKRKQSYFKVEYKPVIQKIDQSPWIVKTSTSVDSKYELGRRYEDELGNGTYGNVIAVLHKETGAMFAMKTINKRYLCDKEEKEMIKREIQIHQVLDHKNIVRLYDIYESPNDLYLVMEKANRGTLEDIISLYNSDLCERDISCLFVQVIDAIVYLHDNGVLQGDIKPANILLNYSKGDEVQTDRGIGKLEVKICDFGLSRKVPDVKYYKHTGDVHKAPYTNFRGTVGYCAPEILSEEAYTIAADMWSVGIILYEIVGGIKPFNPYRDCLREPVRFLPESLWKGTSEECKELILALLQKDPAQRIKAKQARKHPWFELAVFVN